MDEEIKKEISETQKLIRDIVLSSANGQFEFNEKEQTVTFLTSFLGIEKGKQFSFLGNSSYPLLSNNHPIFSELKALDLPSYLIEFTYTGNHNVSMIQKLVGQKGKFAIYKAHFGGMEDKEVLFPIFQTDSGNFLTREEGQKLMTIQATGEKTVENVLIEGFEKELNNLIDDEKSVLEEYNEQLFQEEIEKLDNYFDDLQELCRRQINDIEKEINKLKQERRKLKISEQRILNQQIQQLKKQLLKKQEQITQLHRESADKEDETLNKLNEKSSIKVSIELIAFGKFRIV